MTSLRKLRVSALLPAVLVVLTAGSQPLVFAQSTEDARQAAGAVNEAAAFTVEARQDALSRLQEAARLFQLAGEQVEAAKVLSRIGKLQLNLNNPSAAIESHQQALKLVTLDNEVKVENLNGLAEAYLRWDQNDKAKAAAEQALALSKQLGYTKGEAQAHLILSDVLNYGNHVVALAAAQQALALWSATGDKAGLAKTYAQVGQLYFAQHLLVEAEQNYKTALQIWRELNNRGQEAGALIGLGYIEYRRGDYQRAILFHTQAQGLIDDRAEPMRAGQIATGLAEALSDSGLPEKGQLHYERALRYYEQVGKPDFVAYVVWAIGTTHYLQRKYPEAIAQLNDALSRVPRDSLLAAQCNEYLGRVYVAQGEEELALRHLQLALNAYLKAHNPKEAAQAIALIGQAYQQQGNLSRAREYFERALDGFKKLSDRLNHAAVLFAIGKLEMAQGNYEAADLRLRESIDITENIRRVSISRDLTVAFSASVYDRYQSYIDCLMLRHRTQPTLGFDVRAFEASELARARSLAEFLRAVQPNLPAELDADLAEQEKSLRQALRAKENDKIDLLASDYKKEALNALESEVARLETQYQQVTDAIRARFPAYERTVHPAVLTLPQIQQQVMAGDGNVLLEYMLGEERSYLWVVTQTEIWSYELPPRAQIETAARTFIELLSGNQASATETFDERAKRNARADAQFPKAAASLSDMIIAPALHKLGKRRLLIVPDGILHSIPFQALTVPSLSKNNADEYGRIPLLAEHEFAYEPSASTLAAVLNDSTRRQPQKTIAVFANPVFETDDPRVNTASGAKTSKAPSQPVTAQEVFRDLGLSDGSIPALPASRDEAEAIMSFAPWGTGLKAMDFEANRAAVTQPELAQYRIVHFATHGVIDYQRPELSGLVLSLVDQNGTPQEGYLRLRDIYNLKLSANLVVLSACNTGVGKEIKGEGLIGLTRGFMYAGAGGVAASLWKVDDEATAELMTRFYEGMFRKGLSPSAAMREAQLWMWQQKRWHSPRHWAAFIIQGRYDRSEFASTTSPAQSLVAAAGVVSVLLLTAFFVFGRRRSRTL